MKASKVAKADEKSKKFDEEISEKPSEFPSILSEKVFIN